MFKELPTFFGNSYSVVKGFTDRMLNALAQNECVNARITLPLNYELGEERNLLSKIITYKWGQFFVLFENLLIKYIYLLNKNYSAC
jgi:hypothetical protein